MRQEQKEHQKGHNYSTVVGLEFWWEETWGNVGLGGDLQTGERFNSL